jgi:predicted AAA+ superfamily ATPase
MATPLETFFEHKENFSKSPSLTSFAIGTDNQYDSPLMNYIIESYTRGFYPKTLARWLKNSKAKWTPQANTNWIKNEINDRNMDTCCVTHEKCINALVSIRERGITPENFKKAYKGNKKDTYNEVVAVLEGGFVNMTLFDLDNPLVVLKRG